MQISPISHIPQALSIMFKKRERITSDASGDRDSRSPRDIWRGCGTRRPGGPHGRRVRSPGTRRPGPDTAADTARSAPARGNIARTHCRAAPGCILDTPPTPSSGTCPGCAAGTGFSASRRVAVTSSSGRAGRRRSP
jgi:hypothetical protein